MNASREELFAMLVKKTGELGREATPADFRADPAMPDPNEYAFAFGRFENAAKEAYSKVHSERSGRNITLIKPIKSVQKPAYQTIDHTKHFGRPL